MRTGQLVFECCRKLALRLFFMMHSLFLTLRLRAHCAVDCVLLGGGCVVTQPCLINGRLSIAVVHFLVNLLLQKQKANTSGENG